MTATPDELRVRAILKKAALEHADDVAAVEAVLDEIDGDIALHRALIGHDAEVRILLGRVRTARNDIRQAMTRPAAAPPKAETPRIGGSPTVLASGPRRASHAPGPRGG